MKELIFKYMGYDWLDMYENDLSYPLDANTMIICINKMIEKEEWKTFVSFVLNKYEKIVNVHEFLQRIIQPREFFSLMGEWLGKE